MSSCQHTKIRHGVFYVLFFMLSLQNQVVPHSQHTSVWTSHSSNTCGRTWPVAAVLYGADLECSSLEPIPQSSGSQPGLTLPPGDNGQHPETFLVAKMGVGSRDAVWRRNQHFSSRWAEPPQSSYTHYGHVAALRPPPQRLPAPRSPAYQLSPSLHP